MSPALSAPELLRGLGLAVDGPLRWDQRPASRAPGVFVVEAPAPSTSAPLDIDALRRWLDLVPTLRLDGGRPSPSLLAARLASYWLADQQVLYVGRTSKSLGARVGSLFATQLGHARPHSGGHWLKALRDLPRLRVWWSETEAAEEYEDELISAFASAVGEDARRRLPEGAPVLPWASLGSPTGPTRASGITDALLSVEESPGPPSSVERSDRSGVMRRRPSGGSTTPRSPRRTAAAAAPRREQPTPLSAAGLAALHVELDRLRDVERPLVIERVKHARELGDLRENADYEAARNEQSFLEGRIQELEQRLRTAVVVESPRGGSISLGSTVLYEHEGVPAELSIVGPTESDPASGRISASSPVGRALLGHRAGDVVVVSTPAAPLEYRVIEVR